MWDIEFSDDREIVFSKIKNGKKHVINKFWEEDLNTCWWHVYIVEPDTDFGDCVWGKISPTLRRITALCDCEEEWDF